ncbi:MAG: helix-turn-helix domain-containing protein [Cyanobacteria bacterium P01_H01_bin.74]
MTRRKHKSQFKTKVVLEALKERSSVAELAQKYDAPSQINAWKREFLANASQVFEKGKPAKPDAAQDQTTLLKTIGALKVENDFLKDTLHNIR